MVDRQPGATGCAAPRSGVRDPIARRVIIAATLLLAIPSAARAQSDYVIEGRIVDPNGAGIENAIVQLDGSSPTLSSGQGFFLFEGVRGGERTLRVEAFGYVGASRPLVVDADTALTIALDFAPFALDSLVVAPTRVRVDGRVRATDRDIPIVDADVLSSQGHELRTNRRGGFDLTVWEATPLLLRVRAFGYLPLDTIVAPDERRSYRLFVESDPLVERMIATEIRRIEERAGGRRAVTMRPLDRDDLLRWNGTTLDQVLRLEYPTKISRVACVIVDERSLTPMTAAGVLQTTLARDIERIEFLFEGAMLRVYTREFMRTMLGSGIDLRGATYVDMAKPPFCT